ncbi:MAG: ATP-dependent zinc protease [Alphaproteobacteria bacterium]|nr:ATP-dependent zinc protease [Alphaproteobacteria bacterium]
MTRHRSSPRLIGWREWAALPELGVSQIKAKLDTGAWTSVIHAWDVEPFTKGSVEWVRFIVHPGQHDRKESVQCKAKVADRRNITSSSGHREQRYIIETFIGFGLESWPIELGLTNRDEMGFRLLIGRKAMRGRLIVDPESSFRLGRPMKETKKQRAARPRANSKRIENGEEE